MDNPFKSPAILSFCPGILGIERGLERAGVHCRVMAYVEIEAFIIANLVAGMEAGLLDPAPVWTDAKTFDARPFRGRIHGIIGGYPCPGESLAGLREGHLYKGFIWPAIRRAISAARPLWCFFENVDDHLTGTYPIVQRSLRNMGYRVEAGVYSAEEIGASHERQRLFILAMANPYSSQWRPHITEILSDQGKSNLQWRSEGSNSSSSCSEDVANSIRQGLEIGREQSAWKEQQTAERDGNDVGHTISKSNGGDDRELLNEKRSIQQEKEGEAIIVSRSRPGYSSFPMGQGYEQYEWEQPRVVEPGMGSTIDGYNFREDLLRALGNSVVEQTAELAFVDLLNKQLKNL